MKFKRISQNVFVIGFFLLLFSCQPESQKADMILLNANIWTGNAQQPSAQAMAISGDSILAVGTNEEIQAYQGSRTETIDAQSKFVAPGFIDSHVHLFDGGFNLSSVQLRDAVSPEDFLNRIYEFSKTMPDGTWILGGEWDGTEWNEFPTIKQIDSLTPNHPVFVIRLDGHLAFANSLAIKLGGIDKNSPDVEGGFIGRDVAGEFTGIFKDNAMNLITSKIPTPSNDEFDRAMNNAMDYLVSNGVTSVHNVRYPTDPKGIGEAFARARQKNKQKVRIFDLGALGDWQKLADQIQEKGIGDEWLKNNGLKGVLDGALGSHTAAFFEAYSDAADDKGYLMMAESDLYDWMSKADKANLQIAIHAIGDRAINVLLDNFEKIQIENGGKKSRFRVEHAQHLSSADIPRFAELNVIPSMQPYHAIDDGRWAEKVIGPKRIKTTYAFKSLFDANAKVAFGSDWPVAPASPILGIYAAVTRRTIDDKNPDGWVPEQKITVEQALIAYTKNGAYASFEEEIKGTLEPGKLADFVILSEDLFSIESTAIKDAKVLKTFVGGQKVFDIDSE